VGSDVENFRCPFCLSNDRERHLFLYFDRLDLWSAFKDARIIHFAPERNLSVKIMSCQPRKYVKADLFPADLLRDRVDIERIDVTHINYPNASFDFCICNHVLEHVEDAERALREINRVLRPGGRAVLQTPFSALLHKTIEDPGIMTPHLRLAIYGQDDHARLFGRDFLTTIEKAGLCLQLCPHTKVATLEEAATFGMNPAEDLILVEKGAQLGM